MASRNERKRRAKAREAELRLAVEQALEVERKRKREFNQARTEYVAKTQDALRFHRNPSDKRGKIVGGKFVATLMPEPVKRKLVLNKTSGKMIERRIRYVK